MKRLTRREEVVKHLYTETMRKVMMVIFRFWTMPRDILVGENWQKFTGAQLRANYNYEVDLISVPPMSPAQRKMEAIQLTGFFAQFPNINLQEMEKVIIDAINDPRYQSIFVNQQKPAINGQATSGPPVAGEGQGSVVPGSGASR